MKLEPCVAGKLDMRLALEPFFVFRWESELEPCA